MKRYLPMIFLTVLLFECAQTEEESPIHQFNTSVEDGVMIATTSGGPEHTGELFSYEKILEIRGDPSIEESYLSTPYSPSIDNQGVLFIPDTGNHQIAVYSSEGKFVRSFGQGGEGPNDLQSPTNIQIDGNSLVITSGWTSRGRRQRITRYTKGGHFIDVYNESPEEALQSHKWWLTSSGIRVGVTFDEWWDGDQYFEQRNAIVIAIAGDTIGTVQTEPVCTSIRKPTRIGTGTRNLPTPYLFYARPFVFFQAPDRLVSSFGYVPVIKIFSLTGQLSREIHLQIEPEPITTEDLSKRKLLYDPKVAAERERRSRSAERLDMLLADRNNTLMREHKAYWNWIITSDDGYIWLQRVNEEPFEAYANATYRFRVISPEGRYLGDTTWPAVMQGQITRGCLSAVVLDPDTGEHIPTIYQIRSRVDGLKYPDQ